MAIVGSKHRVRTAVSAKLPLFCAELQDLERWLAREGVWTAQPILALLTACGTVSPRGLKMKSAGGKKLPNTALENEELVYPSDYPTDESLLEMVDSYEALIYWFHLPSKKISGDQRCT